MSTTTRRTPWVVAAVAVQLVLVPVAVFGQLSARLTGDEVLLRVGPVDPIDPFRGAYVALSYPDLQPDETQSDALYGRKRDHDEDRGRLYVVLEERDGVQVAAEYTRHRPDGRTYLACDDDSWMLRCGIESLFLPQRKAAEVQRDINQSGLEPQPTEEYFDEDGNPIDESGNPVEPPDSGYVARVKVDRWGNAAVVDLVKQ